MNYLAFPTTFWSVANTVQQNSEYSGILKIDVSHKIIFIICNKKYATSFIPGYKGSKLDDCVCFQYHEYL